jgi:hypothetical protein
MNIYGCVICLQQFLWFNFIKINCHVQCVRNNVICVILGQLQNSRPLTSIKGKHFWTKQCGILLAICHNMIKAHMEAGYPVKTSKSENDDDVRGTKKRRHLSQRPIQPEGGKHRNQANARERDRTHRWVETDDRIICVVITFQIYADFHIMTPRTSFLKRPSIDKFSACSRLTQPLIMKILRVVLYYRFLHTNMFSDTRLSIFMPLYLQKLQHSRREEMHFEHFW